MWWRIQEVKVDEIVDPQRFEHQHNIAKIDSLDFRNRIVLQLMLVSPRCVETEAFPSSNSPSSSSSLVGRRLAHRSHYQRLHSRPGIVRILLTEARVDHIYDVVNGEASLCDVGRENHFPRSRGCRLKNFCLQVTGQICIDWNNQKFSNLRAKLPRTLNENLLCSLNLLLTSEEDEDITKGLSDVDLKRGHHDGINVVSFRCFCVIDVNWEPSTGNPEDGGIVKELAELLSVQGGGGDQKLEVWPKSGDVLDQTEKNVSVEGPLVRLINYHHLIGGEVWLAQKLPEQHSVRHIFDHCSFGGAVLEPDGVANL